MTLPRGYSIRPPSVEDVPAVAAVLLADDLHDTGHSDYDEDFVRDQWATPGFDPAVDSWVVLGRDDVLVAAAHGMPEGPSLVKSWGVVHPKHRGLGIGSTLLDLIESRALERLAGVDGALLHHSINDVDEAARAMLIARGYGLVRSFRHMQIDLHGPVHAGEPPPGIQIRGADPTRDLPAIHAVLGEAFVEEWGYDVPPFEIWRAREVQGPGSDPSLWAVATDGGRIVGALTAQIWGDRAWIGELGVLPARRGRGIASALLRRSFSIAADRGVPRAMLNVDFENPAGVIALYEKAGMRPVRGYDVYEKPIG